MDTRTRNKALTIGLALSAVAILALEAAAQAAAPPLDGRVSVPIGAWGQSAVEFVLAGAIPLAMWAMRKLPGEMQLMLRMIRIEQLLDKAVKFGLNATQGAVADKTLTFDVGNVVVERALEYATAHAPKLIAQLKPHEWREKILARLTLDENTSIGRIVGPAAATPGAA